MSAHGFDKPRAVVADTSAIIPFLVGDRIDLIEKHPDSFLIPFSVKEEITYPEPKRRYLRAVERRILAEVSADGAAEKAIFAKLRRIAGLGKGERAAIAVALANGHDLATRDEPAIKKALRFASRCGLGLGILRVEDILGMLVVRSRISESEAVAILQRWKETQGIVPVTPFPDVLERLRREA